MNAQTTPQASNEPGQKAPSIPFGRVPLRGRVKAVRRSRGQRAGFLTLLVMPARDEFSSPATVEVFSPERLAEPDAMWQGWCEVGGYRRTYKTEQTDRDGEMRTVTVETADITLTAV